MSIIENPKLLQAKDFARGPILSALFFFKLLIVSNNASSIFVAHAKTDTCDGTTETANSDVITGLTVIMSAKCRHSFCLSMCSISTFEDGLSLNFLHWQVEFRKNSHF